MLSAFKKISTYNKWELDGKTIKITSFEDDDGKLLVGTDVKTGVIYIMDQDIKDENESRTASCCEQTYVAPSNINVSTQEGEKYCGRSW